jgi:hypothetical protein
MIAIVFFEITWAQVIIYNIAIAVLGNIVRNMGMVQTRVTAKR